MRLKNLAEKAHDRKKLKNATAGLMESLDSFFMEAEDKGARGYFECAYMLGTVFEDHCSVQNAQKRVKEKFVADPHDSGIDGVPDREIDWKNTTSIWIYREEGLHVE